MEYIACEFYKIRKYFYDAADKKSKKHNKIVIKRLSDLVIKFLFSFHKVFYHKLNNSITKSLFTFLY